MDSIKNLFENKSSKEIAEIKSQELSKVKKPGSFFINGIEVITNQVSYEDGKLKVLVSLKKDGKDYFINNLNPLYFVNPPIRVPTGEKKIEEINWPNGTTTYEESDIFVEDLEKALEEIIKEVIRIKTK